MNPSTRAQDSALTDREELATAEAELAQLRQRYRIGENDRKSFLNESSNALRKQRNYIERLEEEKQEFRTDMQLVDSLANRKRDSCHLRTMSELMDACAEGDRQISEENYQLEKLDKRIADLKENKLKQRRIKAGWDADQVRHVTSRKKIRTIENKLDKRTVAFNKTLSKNHDIREQIQQLRRDMTLFNTTHKELLRQQMALKDEMNNIIGLSTAAYGSREECFARMSTIRERNEKDEMHYNNVAKDLWRILTHEQRLKDFMNLKAKDRSHMVAARAAEMAKKKTNKPSDKSCMHENEVKSYEAVSVERLKLNDCEPDLDRLVRGFLKKEGMAFALFNYNSELECDIEAMTQENTALKRDIDQFRAQGIHLAGERTTIMRSLESRATDTTTTADATETRLKSARKELDNIFRRIVGFVRKLGCNSSLVTSRLGCRGTISDTNAMTYLGLAEFVCDDILLVEAFRKHVKTLKTTLKKKPAQQASVTTANLKLRPKSPAAVSIIPPSIGEDGQIAPDMELIAGSGVDVSEPLSPGAIRSKVVKAIDRRDIRLESTLKSDWKWQATTVQSSPAETPTETARKATSADPRDSPDFSIHDSESASERNISHDHL